MKSDTIVAIATAMNQAGINIIRINGEEAFPIIDKIYRSRNGKKKLSREKTHTMHYGWIVDGEEKVDEVLVSIMKSPNSYTREDIVEINCHGGIVGTNRILEIVRKEGARLAEPGEFTKRAFLNGRIDLSEAEAVSDLIQSKNEIALKNSVNQLQGSISNKIKELREGILKNTAYIEAALDDPEHYELDGYDKELLKNIEHIEIEIMELLKNEESGRWIMEGIDTIIIGKPNVGKSSLLNFLLGEERAIVTNVEGTTRDSIEEVLRMDGIVLNIVDTAGIRKTKEMVEKIGIKKSIEKIKDADFIIYIVDASLPMDENDEFIIERIREKRGVVLLNKTDLKEVTREEEVKKLINKKIIPFSTKTGRGKEELKEYIKDEFFKGNISYNDEIYITNQRHKECLMEAKDSLSKVKESIREELPEDFYTIDLMDAYQSLGKIIGESMEDDLIDKIFKEFCMGK